MRKHVFPLFAALLLLCTATAAQAKAFIPAKGESFNVRVETYILDEYNAYKRLETGVLPLERQAILAIKNNGYEYDPNGGAQYLVLVRVYCLNPRQAAEATLARAFANSMPDDPWAFMPPLVTDVKVYSPTLTKIPDNVCAGVITVGIGSKAEGGRKLAFHDHASLNCGYDTGCPFTVCEQKSGNAIAKYLGEIFP